MWILAIERFDYKGIERNYLLGAIPWALSRALPVFFALAFGGAFVQSVVDFVEAYKWVADGLTLAGRMLPGLDLQSCFVTFQLNVTFTTLLWDLV